MKNKKGNVVVIALIIIVVAIVAGTGGWFAKKSQTPAQQAVVTQSVSVVKTQPAQNVTKDETVNWKIYKNEKYGFEIKYPSQFTAGSGLSPTENLVHVYLIKNSAYEIARKDPKFSTDVWTAMLNTEQGDNMFDMVYRSGFEDDVLSDSNYAKNFIDNHSGSTGEVAKNYSAKIINLENISTLSGASAKILLGEQWELSDPNNTKQQILQAELYKNSILVTFYTWQNKDRSLIISPEDFKKVVESFNIY